jgi:hypothetical protein
MTLKEFNNLSFQKKYQFVFNGPRLNQIAYREYYNQKVTLWDCGNFFIETYYLQAENEITKIEGFEQTNKRLNIYINIS